MGQIIVQSTNKADTPVDIEEKLEKAMGAIQAQREQKEFADLYLREQKHNADAVVKVVLANMVAEIGEVIQEQQPSG